MARLDGAMFGNVTLALLLPLGGCFSFLARTLGHAFWRECCCGALGAVCCHLLTEGAGLGESDGLIAHQCGMDGLHGIVIQAVLLLEVFHCLRAGGAATALLVEQGSKLIITSR